MARAYITLPAEAQARNIGGPELVS